MIFLDLAVALFVALVLTALFVSMLGWRGRTNGSTAGAFLFFFLILMMASWAGGLWLGPFGPTVVGVSYLPFFVVGLIVAMLLLAVAPPRRQSVRTEGPREDVETVSVLGGAFWALLLLLFLAVLFGYF